MDPLEQVGTNSKKIGFQEYSDLLYNISLNGKNENELDFYSVDKSTLPFANNEKTEDFANSISNGQQINDNNSFNICNDYLNSPSSNLTNLLNSFTLPSTPTNNEIQNSTVNNNNNINNNNDQNNNQKGKINQLNKKEKFDDSSKSVNINKKIKKLKRDIKLKQKLLEKAVKKKDGVNKISSVNQDNLGDGLLPLPNKSILSYSVPVFPTGHEKMVSDSRSLSQSTPMVFSPINISNTHSVLPLSPLVPCTSASPVQYTTPPNSQTPKTASVKQGLLPNPYLNRVQSIYPYYAPYQKYNSVCYAQQHHYHHNYQMQKIQQQHQQQQQNQQQQPTNQNSTNGYQRMSLPNQK